MRLLNTRNNHSLLHPVVELPHSEAHHACDISGCIHTKFLTKCLPSNNTATMLTLTNNKVNIFLWFSSKEWSYIEDNESLLRVNMPRLHAHHSQNLYLHRT